MVSKSSLFELGQFCKYIYIQNLTSVKGSFNYADKIPMAFYGDIAYTDASLLKRNVCFSGS